MTATATVNQRLRQNKSHVRRKIIHFANFLKSVGVSNSAKEIINLMYALDSRAVEKQRKPIFFSQYLANGQPLSPFDITTLINEGYSLPSGSFKKKLFSKTEWSILMQAIKTLKEVNNEQEHE